VRLQPGERKSRSRPYYQGKHQRQMTAIYRHDRASAAAARTCCQLVVEAESLSAPLRAMPRDISRQRRVCIECCESAGSTHLMPTHRSGTWCRARSHRPTLVPRSNAQRPDFSTLDNQTDSLTGNKVMRPRFTFTPTDTRSNKLSLCAQRQAPHPTQCAHYTPGHRRQFCLKYPCHSAA
jgi:hypothetical protein